MEKIIQSRLASVKTTEEKILRLREFLQTLILRILSEGNYFTSLSFVGGTALRILFNVQRFSEDLDFDLTQKSGFDFAKLVQSVVFHLEKFGLSVEVRSREENIVQNAYFKFTDLLQKFDLSGHREEKLSIRLEIDSNPAEGWKREMSVANDVFIFPIWHLSLSSLFAKKIHAAFFRPYLKGRDFYDLVWYLSQRVQPNFELLNSAIAQTEGTDLGINESNWGKFLRAKLEGVDFSALQKDVAPFLINPTEVQMISREIFENLIEKLA